jgi:hypothetical protein
MGVGLERKPGGSSAVHDELHDTAAGTPGKRTLTEQLGTSSAVQRSEAAHPRAEAAGAGGGGGGGSGQGQHWKAPGAGVVSSWLAHWTTLWTSMAGQAFNDFTKSVEKDSNDSGNVGALVSMAGNATWVLGGLTAQPGLEILGASLSSIGSFVPKHPEQDSQVLKLIRKGLDKFSSKLNDGVDVRSNWEYILDKPDFRHAGTDEEAHRVLRKYTHIPNTDNQEDLRHRIEFKLIEQYLHHKNAYIKIYYSRVNLPTDVRLANVSQDVTRSFSNDMDINPIPNDGEGHLTKNPFHLRVQKV